MIICQLCLVFLLIFYPVCSFSETDRAEFPGKAAYAMHRSRMVEHQIARRGIKNRKVLEAFRKVQRHRFVPERYRSQAYEDHPLPIGEGQTISQPYIVAYMTEALGLNPSDRVLEVGTGSGYQAAILAELCDHVFSIEIVESLGKRAEALLKDLGYQNISIKIGDGYQGWEEHAPFDAIIVTCAPTDVPAPLKRQLKEGGLMVIPVGARFAQDLVLLRKQKGALQIESSLPVRFVPMVNSSGQVY